MMARKETPHPRLSVRLTHRTESRVQQFTESEISIGRTPGNAIQIVDPEVSGNHARLLSDHHGGLTIIDLGSTNGTWVNGIRIENEHYLVSGDEVRVGSARLELLDDESEATGQFSRPHDANGSATGNLGSAPRLAEPGPKLAESDDAGYDASLSEPELLSAPSCASAPPSVSHEISDRPIPGHRPPILIAPGSSDIYSGELSLKEESGARKTLHRLLADPEVQEIVVAGTQSVTVRRGDRTSAAPAFSSEAELASELEKLLGRPLSTATSEIAILPSGWMIRAAHAGIRKTGPIVRFERRSREPWTLDRLVGTGRLPHSDSTRISQCIASRRNLLLTYRSGTSPQVYLEALLSEICGQGRALVVTSTFTPPILAAAEMLTISPYADCETVVPVWNPCFVLVDASLPSARRSTFPLLDAGIPIVLAMPAPAYESLGRYTSNPQTPLRLSRVFETICEVETSMLS